MVILTHATFDPITKNVLLGWHHYCWSIWTPLNNFIKHAYSNFVVQAWTKVLSTSLNLESWVNIKLLSSNMIQTSCPFNCPNSFKLKAKYPMKSYNNNYASCTSPPIIDGLIFDSHVFMVTCILGWDDGTSSTFKVDGMACDCYTECEEMPPCFSTPTSRNSCSTPINHL
jgi:hypothetical protein